MSKINELIQTLCPDGVEYKKLGEVATINRGNGFQKKDFTEEGRPCIHYGQIFMHYSKLGIATNKTLTYLDDAKYEKNVKALPNDVVMAVTSENVEDVCKCVVWEGDEPVAVSGHTAIFHTEMNSKFLAYWFNTSDFYVQKVRLAHGTKVIEVTPAAMADIVLPVPTMAVQDEIVRILDEYTRLEAELEAKLSEEIELKQKQYEYCASKLFEDLNVEYISMSELAKFKYGYTDKASDSGNARFIRITDIDDFGELSSADEKYITLTDDAEKYLLTKGSLVVARTGATYGKTLYFDSDEPSVYASFLIKIDFDNNQVFNRYYWHFTKTSLYWEQANKYVKVGGQQQFNSPALGRVCVPVPSITEQERIVKILDKYDTYTRDMISTLNTELEFRKKQYVYYRDQLLTFKRKEV